MPRLSYSPEIAHAVLSALRIGCSERDACVGAGLAWRTWSDWKRDVRAGKCTDENVIALVESVPQASAQGRNAIAAKINKLAGKDYRAGAWLLEWHEKRRERAARLALLRAEIELARLKIAAGGVEKHEHAVSAELTAARANLAAVLAGDAGAVDPSGTDGGGSAPR